MTLSGPWHAGKVVFGGQGTWKWSFCTVTCSEMRCLSRKYVDWLIWCCWVWKWHFRDPYMPENRFHRSGRYFGSGHSFHFCHLANPGSDHFSWKLVNIVFSGRRIRKMHSGPPDMPEKSISDVREFFAFLVPGIRNRLFRHVRTFWVDFADSAQNFASVKKTLEIFVILMTS